MAKGVPILADLVDLRLDPPLDGEPILVDTNVWNFFVFPSFYVDHYRRTRWYTSALKRLVRAETTLYHSGLSLSELAHMVEKHHWEAYKRKKRKSKVTIKQFRAKGVCREAVVEQVQAAWSQVIEYSEPLEAHIDAASTAAALASFQTYPLDGYDLFLLESMRAAGITRILTDDQDFARVEGLEVLTANRGVLE